MSDIISALASGVDSLFSSGVGNVGDALTSAIGNTQALSVSAINRGAAAAQNKQYDLAIKEFKRAAAYDPQNVNVYSYMGQVYMMMGQTSDAIDAYQQGLKVDPTYDDLRNQLATAYVQNQDYNHAETEFKALAKTNPQNPGPPTSLGQIYMMQGRYAEADTQFNQVLRIAPDSATAYDNLGKLRNKQGNYTDAAHQFQKALQIDPQNEQTMADLARAYIGLGDTTSARNLYSRLLDAGTTSALSLAADVYHDINTPKIFYEEPSRSNFSALLGPGTSLTALDASLATPGASKLFKITFTFNQGMDPLSVTNALNWTITKASGGNAGVYNSGGTYANSTDVNVPIAPLGVTYDAANHSATVYFRITQNAAGNGTIDPSHLVFQFNGKDAYGRSMDKGGDQYDGHHIMPF